jgi:hypothetical protein
MLICGLQTAACFPDYSRNPSPLATIVGDARFSFFRAFGSLKAS